MKLRDGLRQWRSEQGMTQREAAAFWGYSREWWCRMERGSAPIVGPLAKIMTGLTAMAHDEKGEG